MTGNRIIPRLLLGFFLLSPLPLGVLAWLYTAAFERTLTQTVLTNLTSLADKKADQINTYLSERLQDGQMLARSDTAIRALDTLSPLAGSGTKPVSERYQAEEAGFRSFFYTQLDLGGYYDLLLTDLAGNVVLSVKHEQDYLSNLNTGPFRNSTLARAHREALALLGSRTTSAQPYAPSGNRPAIFIVTPVMRDGRPIGTVALQLNLDRLTGITTDNTGLGMTGETVLAQAEPDGALYVGPLNHVRDAAFHYHIPMPKVARPMQAALTGGHGSGLTRDYAGIDIIAAWRYLPALRWGMVVKMDTDEAFAPAHALRRYTYGALALLLLISAGVALLFGRSLVLPIHALTQVTRRIAGGDLTRRAEPTGCDEYRELASSFNLMADQIGTEKALLEERVAQRTAELQDSMSRYDRLVERIPSGVYTLRMRADGGMRFEYVSPRFCQIVGVAAADVMADVGAVTATLHPDDRDDFLARNIEAARNPGPFLWEGRCQVDQETRWLRIEATPTPASNGDSLWNGMVSDISEDKRNTQALEQARQTAEAANRAKSVFLANMSHEIRTPMNAILGLTELVLDSDLDAQQREFLSITLTSGRALLGILNDILDYSKIEAGRMAVEQVEMNVDTVLREVADLFSARIAEKGLEFRIDAAPEVPSRVLGDPLRLTQVLNNLIGNAIKFTNQGEIAVRVDAARIDADNLILRFSVRDTGIGIARAQAAHLFEAFTQADSSITRHYGGTGLGLAISQKLVHLMGGEIDATGIEGQGSTFSFTVRVGRAAGTAEATARRLDVPARPSVAARYPGARALLVEDNPLNQQVAAELLKKRGLSVSLASHGKEAIDQVRAAAFDIVFMDLHMPEMNGIEAAKAILALPVAAGLPIVAMTAAVFPEDRTRCQAAGMVDFIAKPIEMDRLDAVLAKWLAAWRKDEMQPIPTEPDAAMPDLPGFDTAAGLRRLEHNQALYRRLLLEFARTEADTPADLLPLLATGRNEAVAERLHRIKGLAANLGASALADATGRFEAELRAGAEPVSQTEFAHCLKQCVDGIRRGLPPAPRETGDAPDMASLLTTLRRLVPYLEQHELPPDELSAGLEKLARHGAANAPLHRLLGQLDEFNHDGALATLAAILASHGDPLP
jgi:PAS domain S-box-containing protein